MTEEIDPENLKARLLAVLDAQGMPRWDLIHGLLDLCGPDIDYRPYVDYERVTEKTLRLRDEYKAMAGTFEWDPPAERIAFAKLLQGTRKMASMHDAAVATFQELSIAAKLAADIGDSSGEKAKALTDLLRRGLSL